MKRTVLKQLQEWKHKSNRKPLILNGARQVGKTYILREFGEKYYEKVAYVNCDKNELVEKIFTQDYNIERILLSLSALVNESFPRSRLDGEQASLCSRQLDIELSILHHYCPRKSINILLKPLYM